MGKRSRHREVRERTRFASNLRKIMRKTGVTQMQLSIDVETCPGAVCKWCQGKSVPYSTTLKRIAQALGCTTDELLKGVWE